MAKKKETQQYDDQSIEKLEGADRVRLRPAVIFGSDGLEGCAHSVFEIISNSIDEAREGASGIEEQAAQLDAQVAVELNSIEHNNETIARITREMELAVESKQTLDDEITETMKTVELLKNAEKQKRVQLAEAAEQIEGIQAQSRSFVERIAALSEEISQFALKIGDCRVEI